MLVVEEVTRPEDFTALAPAWCALVDACADATPFQSWEWVSSWWEHLGSGRPWVLVAREGGQVVGLLPLVITRWRGTLARQVRFMGAPLSDYQDLIAPEPRAAECARAFLAHVAREKKQWDLCDLNDLREGSALPSALPADSLRGQVDFHRVCPLVTLEGSYDGYVKSLSKNTRASIGRRRRQLERQFGATLDLAGESNLRESLGALFRLHNARWQRRGAAGAFSDPKVQAFHRAMAPKLLARDMLRLHRLQAGERTLGAFYCFRHGARVYYYLSGFDQAVARFSPGNVLMARVIEHAFSEGAREVDLLRGDESYKYQWNAEDRRTLRMILGHGSWRSRFGTDGHRLERFIERKGLAVQKWLWGRGREPESGAS
jgi:CelD/BcsL family acetyltransferase involved in cellulose biosynthesis